MNITSTHLKLVKVIGLFKNITPDELAEEFSLDISTVRLYLKEIGKYLEIKEKKLSPQDLIDTIHKKKNLLRELRKDHLFEKAERKNIIIYYLLVFPFVNLSSLADVLKVTKRTLNYDLQEIKKDMLKSYGEIGQSKKGIYLKCSNYKKVRIMGGILYKIALEKEYIPRVTRGLYAELIRRSGIKSHYKFKKQCREICEIVSPNYTKYSEITLPLIFYGLNIFNKDEKIKDTLDKKLFKYWDKNISKESFFKIIEILKESPFGEVSKIHTPYIMRRIYECSGDFTYISTPILKSLKKVKVIIEEYLGDEYVSGDETFSEGKKWIEYCFFRKQLNIFDLNITLMNLSINKDEKMEKAVKEIKKFIPLFSRGDFLKIMGTYKRKTVKNRVFVYSSLLIPIKDMIKERLERNYSIKISKTIHRREIKDYLKENPDDEVIVVENIPIKGVKNLLKYKI